MGQERRPRRLAHFTQAAIWFLGVTVALLTTGCVRDLGPDPFTLWEANLTGDPGHPTISGNAAAISRSAATEVGISLQGLEAGSYPWGLAEGTCASPGAGLAAEAQYLDLVAAGEPATVAMETVVSGATMRGGGRYHAEVREAESNRRIACGDFVQR